MAAIFGYPIMRAHSRRMLNRMTGSRPVIHVPGTIDASGATPAYPSAFVTYPVTPSPSGWLPPAAGANPAALPFSVRRTASREIPVYTDFKHGRTKVLTLVRGYSGDGEALAVELSKLTGRPAVMRSGRIEVEGNVVTYVKTWLAGLGL